MCCSTIFFFNWLYWFVDFVGVRVEPVDRVLYIRVERDAHLIDDNVDGLLNAHCLLHVGVALPDLELNCRIYMIPMLLFFFDNDKTVVLYYLQELLTSLVL